MSLDSPITYAEWYWKHSLDAQEKFAEDTEKGISPFISDIINEIAIPEDTPDSINSLYGQLKSPTGQFTAAILLRFASEVADAAVQALLAPTLEKLTYAAYRKFNIKLMTPAETALLFQRNKIEDFELEYWRKSGGYDEKMWGHYVDANRPYPSIPDIIRWARYNAGEGGIEAAAVSKFNIDTKDFELWEWMGLQQLNTLQAQALLKRGTIDEPYFNAELGRIGWHSVDRDNIKDLAYIVPNSMLLVQGGLIQGVSDETIIENISKGDIHPDYAQTYLDAVLTKPASIDLMAYHLRKDPSLSTLEQELKKIGVHPNYTDVYKTLAYQIPPVADIITMAVREAFTPTIAAKFGQYEDFPPDLEKYAGQKGLSKEWAERYWAAHWALPSPQQGFEMLHRGVINTTELDMLLRAQDVMPFWRDRLTAIAYRPLTRVDVRRMYKQGVLNETEVFESYQDQGYDDKNAERMAEFTVRQTLASLSKFTSSDIIKAFSNRMIDRNMAISLLRDIDIRADDANYIVSTAEYKRLWAFTDDQIAGIRNLYKKRIYDINQASDKLARLNLPADQIDVLMQQWHYEKIEELDATWSTAQTLKFLKRKLITSERARRELNLNGFTDERIDIYLRDMQWTPPKV